MTDFDINQLRGLKHRDFKPCLCCGKGVMHAGSISFYRVTIEHCVIDAREIQRAAGMEMMMGGNALIANIMGPDADLAKVLSENRGLLCQDCGLRQRQSVAGLSEVAAERSAGQSDSSTAA
jgi:hypothetical protein